MLGVPSTGLQTFSQPLSTTRYNIDDWTVCRIVADQPVLFDMTLRWWQQLPLH